MVHEQPPPAGPLKATSSSPARRWSAAQLVPTSSAAVWSEAVAVVPGRWAYLAVVALVAAVGLGFWMDPYSLHVVVLALYYAYLAQAWNILSGYAGQFSFGHAAFFGIGGYTSSVLFARYDISPWLGLLAGAALSAAAGFLIGYLCFRYGLRGPYFALATLAFAEILRVIANNWRFVGGPMGLLLPLRESVATFQFPDSRPYYFVILTMAAAVTFLAWRMERSRFGAALAAVREDEDAAEALGVDTARAKLGAVALSAGLTALGGTFYAQYFSYIDPSLAFGTDVSIAVLLPAIVGGVGSALGPVVGAAVLTPLGEFTRAYLGGYRGVHLMIYGAILVAVVIGLPRGLVGLWSAHRRPQH